MVLGSLLEDLGGVVLRVRTWGVVSGSLLEGICRITTPHLICITEYGLI